MNPPSTAAPYRCHQCDAAELVVAPGFSQVSRVTSDCKPWPPGGILAWCPQCGLLQTVTDAQWQAEVSQIYDGYTIYHQSGGKEQPVFDTAGAGRSRSDAIVAALQKRYPLPNSGRLLDVGCGNGAFLQACSRAMPGWTFCGSEVNDKYRSVVEAIPRVERLHTEPIEKIPGTFDLISLIHVIEHIPAPGSYLKGLIGKLNPGGLLLLETPDCSQNFFALLIADHCSHFSPSTLGGVAVSGGYELLEATGDWVPKEASVLARRLENTPAPVRFRSPTNPDARVFAGWEALQSVIAQVDILKQRQPFGIFGTSIAATWLQAQTGNTALFFVDEDPERIGKRHLGCPILGVTEIPELATVYVALAPAVAARVAARLRTAKPKARIEGP